MTILKVNKNDENQTVFNFIKKNFKTTNLSIIYKWFRTNKIKINDKRIKDQKIILKFGDEIKVYDSASAVKRQNNHIVDYSLLKVVYEDDNILIADKPSGLEIHSPINENLDEMVRSYLIEKKEYNIENENSFVISHVHRIDKLTRGLVIYAKNKMSLDILLTSIQEKDEISKFYLAKLVNNDLPEGLVNGWIRYDSEKQVAVFREIQKNSYKESNQINQIVDEQNNIYSIQLLSGRKHQIRSICSFYKAPIVGDFRYGAPRNGSKQIELIAYKLIFNNLQGQLSYLNNQEFISNYKF
ncbi:pseudouridine synthase family protein [Spiroplasma culicicola]|uniref:RNA pseudouridylate synthase n=1 Tax=Spiroplasma culicicola AES-1 TaxID=1276246 RepID=W6A688_9MOLU|nr:RluA family pseudouridine synthase [Spiroplasma culicicola]AHI52466.1 ribosomal large subunit pseudouridine synthase C [Spiroplasma culicicola AES-1]